MFPISESTARTKRPDASLCPGALTIYCMPGKCSIYKYFLQKRGFAGSWKGRNRRSAYHDAAWRARLNKSCFYDIPRAFLTIHESPTLRPVSLFADSIFSKLLRLRFLISTIRTALQTHFINNLEQCKTVVSFKVLEVDTSPFLSHTGLNTHDT